MAGSFGRVAGFLSIAAVALVAVLLLWLRLPNKSVELERDKNSAVNACKGRTGATKILGVAPARQSCATHKVLQRRARRIARSA